jgi:hypothetical protein
VHDYKEDESHLFYGLFSDLFLYLFTLRAIITYTEGDGCKNEGLLKLMARNMLEARHSYLNHTLHTHTGQVSNPGCQHGEMFERIIRIGPSAVDNISSLYITLPKVD